MDELEKMVVRVLSGDQNRKNCAGWKMKRRNFLNLLGDLLVLRRIFKNNSPLAETTDQVGGFENVKMLHHADVIQMISENRNRDNIFIYTKSPKITEKAEVTGR